MPLFSMLLLLRGNLQDPTLSDLLGVAEINPVLAEVLQALLFIPFKQHICISELYDAVPKYFSSKKRMAEQRRDGQFLSSLKHDFRHKDKHYLVKITPPRIEEKDGTESAVGPVSPSPASRMTDPKCSCIHVFSQP
jgi:hypothetical protein